MKRHHHRHLRLAYIIILIGLAISGAWLFLNGGPSPPTQTPAYLSAQDNEPGDTVNLLIFPNATTRINLTLNEATTGARLKISGTARDFKMTMGGRNILQSNGKLAGNDYLIDYAAATIYDARDAPFIDLNFNGIADDYEARHRLTAEQIRAVNSIDNMTPIQKYEYYSRTGREIDPLRIDTDGDGYEDATEKGIGTNPIDYRDQPLHSFAEKPHYFAQNEILSDPRILVYWSFDTPGQDQMGRAPLTILNNSHIEPGPNGMALHTVNKSQGASAQPNKIFDDMRNFTIMALVTTSDNRSRYIAYLTTPEGAPAIAMDYGSGMPACEAAIGTEVYKAQIRVWRALSNGWNHIIMCTREAGQLRLYVDGKMEDEEAIPDEPIRASGPIRIGAQNDTTNQFYELIDSIAIYNSSLNQSEIDRLFTITYAGQDQDADGQGDPWEIKYGLSPRVPSDAMRDDDRDGLINLEEYRYYLLTGRAIDPKLSDTDSDGYSDLAEKIDGTDPTDPTDHPGLSIDTTLDSDQDRMPDWWELKFGLPIRVADADKDNDKDNLTNIEEYSYLIKTARMISPLDPDSNDNGVKDGEDLKRAADPSSAPEKTIWLNLPGRINLDIARGARIKSAQATIMDNVETIMANQNDVRQYRAKGTFDITRLLRTDCATPECRNVITIRKTDEETNASRAVITGIDIRYELEPTVIDPLPLCPSYPCTIPLSARSTAAGNVTITLSKVRSCDTECQSGASLRCGIDAACETQGKTLQKAVTPEELIRGAPTETQKIYSRLKLQLTIIGAVGLGLASALAYVFVSRRRMRSPAGAAKTKEKYIENARSYLTGQTAKGQSIEHATAKLIESGWPAKYVEEAARRMGGR